MNTKNKIFLAQTEHGPRLPDNLSLVTLSNTSNMQPISIPLTKLFRHHVDFEDIHRTLRDFRQPRSFHLSLDTSPLKLIGQLRIIGVNAKDIPWLCLFDRLLDGINCGLEFPSDTWTRVATMSKRPIIIFIITVLLLDI